MYGLGSQGSISICRPSFWRNFSFCSSYDAPAVSADAISADSDSEMSSPGSPPPEPESPESSPPPGGRSIMPPPTMERRVLDAVVVQAVGVGRVGRVAIASY